MAEMMEFANDDTKAAMITIFRHLKVKTNIVRENGKV